VKWQKYGKEKWWKYEKGGGSMRRVVEVLLA
jgi:hypothetical protein